MRYPNLYDRSRVDFSVIAQKPVRRWHASDAARVCALPDTQLCGAAGIAAVDSSAQLSLTMP
jgi:hypothetical protein